MVFIRRVGVDLRASPVIASALDADVLMEARGSESLPGYQSVVKPRSSVRPIFQSVISGRQRGSTDFWIFTTG